MKTYKECEITVDILGTPYTIIICPENSDKRFKQLNCGGFCDYSSKKLYISNYVGLEDDKDPYVDDCQYIIQKAIMHEMVHAYFYESGLGEDWEHKQYGQEETVVDWIARQLSKMHETAEIIFEKIHPYKIEI